MHVRVRLPWVSSIAFLAFGWATLPDLLIRLQKKPESTSKQIVAKTDTARELSAALKQAASEIPDLKKLAR